MKSLNSVDYKNLYRNETIAEIAARKAEERPHDIAIYLESGEHITFGSIYEEARNLAGALMSLGCKAGDVVSFQLPNWRESVAVDISTAMLGLVVNPIIPIYRDKEVSFILQDTGAKVFVVPQSFRNYDFPAMVSRLKCRLPSLEQVVVVGGPDQRTDGFLSYQALLADSRVRPIDALNVDPDNVKILLYTSGTTGNPKAVRHSHNTFARAFDNGCEAWSLGRSDIMLMPSPVTHITGYANGIELPFLSKAKTAFMEQWDAQRAVEYINGVKATACLSATPFLQELVNVCRASGEGLPSLRFFASGGAAVPPNLIYDAHRVFERCRVFRVYGSTEVPLVTVGFIDPEQESLAAETDGRIYNYEVRIEDDDGNALGTGVDGEILVRGPAMMLGYGESAQNAGSISDDGFFRTGDIGHITVEGALVITDRKKDIIIRGGENISAREIEDVLHAHPDIDQVAAVAMPHPRLGEGVCAVVVLEDNASDISLDALKPFLAESGLAKQKWPERIEVREQLPKTASGKVRKDQLRAELKALASAGS